MKYRVRWDWTDPAFHVAIRLAGYDGPSHAEFYGEKLEALSAMRLLETLVRLHVERLGLEAGGKYQTWVEEIPWL